MIKIGIVLAIGLVWAATMIYIYRDMSNRNLPGWQQSIWVVVSLVPVAGLVAYLVARVAGRSAPAGPPSPRVTMLQEPGRRPPTVPVVAGGPHAGEEDRMMARFSVTEGAHRGQQFIVREFPALVGREPDCVVRLDQDLSVSRRHAELSVRGDRLWIADLGSTHGTFVNDQRIAERGLSRGDKVRVGNSLLVLRV